MRKKKKSVFEALFEKDICFAVCITPSHCVRTEFLKNFKDYFVIINKADAGLLDGFIFTETAYHFQVFERNLSPDEIAEFKEIQNRFIKVKHDSAGRVYELKDKSFKATFKAMSPKRYRLNYFLQTI